MMIFDEIWAVKTEIIQAFFEDLKANAIKVPEGDVSVIPLPDKQMGKLALPQTRIIIQGERADQIYREFFLHFMRSGG